MKFLFPLFFIFSLLNVSSQTNPIIGKWYGTLNAMGQEMPIGTIFKQNSNTISGELTNPKLKSKGIKMDSISFQNNIICFEVKRLNIKFNGSFTDSKIKGTFSQNGMTFPLEFSQKEIKIAPIKRPQTPKPPFNYYTEEIFIQNTIDSISLAGTLTLPTNDSKKYPVVILISGSGPQNRDSEIFEHKSFLLIADFFAKQGIGTFRFDERGIGKSTGKYSSCDLNDFYRDIDFIYKNISKRKNISKIGLLGHSEGGIIAPWYATNQNNIEFIIMLAAPGVEPKEMMHEQRKLQTELMGGSLFAIKMQEKMFREIDSTVLNTNNSSTLAKNLRKITDKQINMVLGAEKQKEDLASQIIPFVTSKWYKSFILVNPNDYLSKIKCPVLAINGNKDMQVPMEMNLNAIENSLKNGKCKDYTILRKENLNHLFQHCKIGSVSEYSKIDETFSPKVLHEMATWVLSK